MITIPVQLSARAAARVRPSRIIFPKSALSRVISNVCKERAMDAETVSAWLAAGEGEHTEFKEKYSSPSSRAW